jgi:DNA replication protein DnaC
MDQVGDVMTALTLGREADRDELRRGAEGAGSPAALVRQRFPFLGATCPPELTEAALVAETVAWYEDAEARLALCATCPPTGASCHGSSSLFKQGQLPVWRGARVERDRCPRYREWRLCQRLAVSNVPERYRACTIKGFKIKTDPQVTAVAAVAAFYESVVSGSSPWLVLDGPGGAGKTHLGCAVLRSIPSALPRTHFWYSDMNELRIQMKGYNFDSGEADPMDRLRDTEVLVFDNLDIKRLMKDAWLVERVESVLYQRWNRRRATLITTHGTFGDIVVAFPGITTLKEAVSCSLA